MLKISKLADYATVVMNFLASEPERLYSAPEISKQVHIAVPTVSKVLKKLLAKGNLVISTRGANGGYRLARSAKEITIIEVISAIDGHPAMTECSQHSKVCVQDSVCAVKNNWRLINQVILTLLQSLTLADMSQPLTLNPLITNGLKPMRKPYLSQVNQEKILEPLV
jgi:Fe-S cluster assembly protein SufB